MCTQKRSTYREGKLFHTLQATDIQLKETNYSRKGESRQIYTWWVAGLKIRKKHRGVKGTTSNIPLVSHVVNTWVFVLWFIVYTCSSHVFAYIQYFICGGELTQLNVSASPLGTTVFPPGPLILSTGILLVKGS